MTAPLIADAARRLPCCSTPEHALITRMRARWQEGKELRRTGSRAGLVAMSVLWLLTVVLAITRTTYGKQVKKPKKAANQDVVANATDKVTRGRQVFRFDTFSDEAFWGGTL